MTTPRGKIGVLVAARAVKLSSSVKNDGGDTSPLQKKRQSLKDPKKDQFAYPDVIVPKEGEIYYRTVRSHPSIPECPEDISITVTKNLENFVKDNLTSSFSRRDIKKVVGDFDGRDSNSPALLDRPEFGR